MVKHRIFIYVLAGLLVAPLIIDFLSINPPPFYAIAIGFTAGYLLHFKYTQK